MAPSARTSPKVGPPAAITIPEILIKILTYVVSEGPIPVDPVNDRLYLAKSTLSKQAILNLRNICLVCRQWFEIGTRIRFWPIIWSNSAETGRDWWDKALGLTTDANGNRRYIQHHNLQLVCAFSGGAVVRDSIWCKKYVWHKDNHGYWIKWLDEMRQVQQGTPQNVYMTPMLDTHTVAESERRGRDSVGSKVDVSNPPVSAMEATAASRQPRLNIRELVMTGHFEVDTHVIPLLTLPNMARNITLLELRFYHYTLIDPRHFFHVSEAAEESPHDQDKTDPDSHELPPLPNLRHLILGKVHLRENKPSLLRQWTPRQPSLLQTLSLDCMADPSLMATFLRGVCGPETKTLQLYLLPLMSYSNAPQAPLTSTWAPPQPNVVEPPMQTHSSTSQERQPHFLSTIDMLLHISTQTPNLSRISIESINTVQTLLTLSKAFPRVELIENYVSRYTRKRIECSPPLPPPQQQSAPSSGMPSPSTTLSESVNTSSVAGLQYQSSLRPKKGLSTTYFLTSLKIPIWRGGNVEAGRHLHDLAMDNSGFGLANSSFATSAPSFSSTFPEEHFTKAANSTNQLADPEWDWFQFFQSDHARYLKQLQLPSHMLAIGYLDPFTCPRWTCTELEELAIEFFPGQGKNTHVTGNTTGNDHNSSNNGSGINRQVNRVDQAATATATTTTTATTRGTATMTSTLDMSRRVLGFIVTSFPKLRRLSIWRSCVNLSDNAGGFCFLSRLRYLESLALKSTHKYLWYWPRPRDRPFEDEPRWLLAVPTAQDRAKGKTSLQMCRTIAELDDGLGYFGTQHGQTMLWPSDAANDDDSIRGNCDGGEGQGEGLHHASSSVSSSSSPTTLEEGCLWENMQEICITLVDHTDDQEGYVSNTCNILRSLRPDIRIIDS
ncbi:hypothetical protein BGW42_004535 [Actinomortierella wolfii]|nr:hypothetical protein BGW42_004535 [Actinomortierella wolfii]